MGTRRGRFTILRDEKHKRGAPGQPERPAASQSRSRSLLALLRGFLGCLFHRACSFFGSPLELRSAGARTRKRRARQIPFYTSTQVRCQEKTIPRNGRTERGACNSRFCRNVITVARQQSKVGPAQAHLDAVVFDGAIGLLRHIAEGVLVAGLLGDPRVECFQVRAV